MPKKVTLNQQIEMIGEKLIAQSKPLTFDNFKPEIFGYYEELTVKQAIQKFLRLKGLGKTRQKPQVVESVEPAKDSTNLVEAVQSLTESINRLAIFLESIDARTNAVEIGQQSIAQCIAKLEKEWSGS